MNTKEKLELLLQVYDGGELLLEFLEASAGESNAFTHYIDHIYDSDYLEYQKELELEEDLYKK